MKQLKLIKTEFKFDIGKVTKRFSVYHNLPDTFGLSIENAFDSWLFRTSNYTPGAFCRYVMSKQDEYVCMTEKTFKRLNTP
jgi:hypothetical protein